MPLLVRRIRRLARSVTQKLGGRKKIQNRVYSYNTHIVCHPYHTTSTPSLSDTTAVHSGSLRTKQWLAAIEEDSQLHTAPAKSRSSKWAWCNIRRHTTLTDRARGARQKCSSTPPQMPGTMGVDTLSRNGLGLATMESRLPLCQRSTTLSSSTIRGDEDYQYWTVDGCFKNYTKDHNGQHFESVGFSYHEAEEEDNILFSTQNLDTYAH